MEILCPTNLIYLGVGFKCSIGGGGGGGVMVREGGPDTFSFFLDFKQPHFCHIRYNTRVTFWGHFNSL